MLRSECCIDQTHHTYLYPSSNPSKPKSCRLPRFGNVIRLSDTPVVCSEEGPMSYLLNWSRRFPYIVQGFDVSDRPESE